MRFSVEHCTVYHFSGPVFLDPHVIRLTPRNDARQRILSMDMDLNPVPSGQWAGLDQEDNSFFQVWFDGLHRELAVTVRLEAETLRVDPFGFFLAQTDLPVSLTREEAVALAPCLVREAPEASPEADRLAAKLANETKGKALDFLSALNLKLFETLEKVKRIDPGIQAPDHTLVKGQGACRDAAVLFMDCCRSRGIPARFVSGYQAGAGDEPGVEQDLHAWAEAWLPGAGWLGFDPTHGLLAAESHLILAASSQPELAAPLAGSFRGTGARSHLEHQVSARLAD